MEQLNLERHPNEQRAATLAWLPKAATVEMAASLSATPMHLPTEHYQRDAMRCSWREPKVETIQMPARNQKTWMPVTSERCDEVLLARAKSGDNPDACEEPKNLDACDV